MGGKAKYETRVTREYPGAPLRSEVWTLGLGDSKMIGYATQRPGDPSRVIAVYGRPLSVEARVLGTYSVGASALAAIKRAYERERGGR